MATSLAVRTNQPAALDAAALRAMLPLLRQINDLKRIAFYGDASIAAHRFEQAWQALIAASDVGKVAAGEACLSVVSCVMGPIGPENLRDGGMNDAEIRSVWHRALGDRQLALAPSLSEHLRKALPPISEDLAELPDWVGRLRHVERAGATCPGKRRIVLKPQENHAEHCWVVAVCAALIALAHDDDPADAFLLGMSHHMANAWLPDGGFAGEMALGNHLPGLIRRFETKALDSLPGPLAARIRALLDGREDIARSSVRYFNAADAIDRVLQMAWFEEAANFKLSYALEDLEIVHAGALKSFQDDVLRDIGLQ